MSTYGSWSTTRPTLGQIINNLNGTSIPVVDSTSLGSITRSGTITLNFGRVRRITKRGSTNLPINDFSYSKNIWCPHVGSIRDWDPNGSIDQTYSGSAASLINGAIDNCKSITGAQFSTLQNRAKSKVLEKLKDQKVNLVQVYAERKMTADLIGSTATRIGNAIIEIRRGNLRAAARQLGTNVSRRQVSRFNSEYRSTRGGGNAIANGFLEVQYGWRPLLADVQGSAEFIAQKQSREIRERVSTRIPFRAEDKVKTSLPGYFALDVNPLIYDYNMGVWFQTSGVALASLSQAGITNPLAIAWELTPWSFVADWFLPVGSYIGAFDATLGLSFQRGYITTFSDSTRSVYVFRERTAPTGRQYSGYSTSSRTQLIVVRTKMLSFPDNPFPTFKNPFSFEHCANACALLTQLFVNRKV